MQTKERIEASMRRKNVPPPSPYKCFVLRERRTCSWVLDDKFYQFHEYLRNLNLNMAAATIITFCKMLV